MKSFKFKFMPVGPICIFFIVTTAYVLFFETNPSVLKKVFFIFITAYWILHSFALTIGINSEGIVSLYSLGGRVIKVHTRINFQDILTVKLTKRDQVIVYSNLDTHFKNKKMIILPKSINNRNELLCQLAKSTSRIEDDVCAIIK